MGIRIDITGSDYAAPALGILDDSSYYSLGVVFGADLCVLGGTRHPTCWEPLKDAWHQLDEHERERIFHSRVQSMLDRGLIAALPSGPGSHASLPARYVLGDDRYRDQVGRHRPLPCRPGRRRGQQRARSGRPVTGATRVPKPGHRLCYA